ncbi:MAG: O-methyltransferase [Peptostreptococcaceae bacterium]|nr:O-methyltransferase [Peptostreptococcaceae bacterium]
MNITNDIVTEYIHNFYRPLSVELDDLREVSEEENIPIILKETENFLVTFLKITKPKKILEIGTAIGYSSIVFANSLEDVRITTIEKDNDLYIKAKSNLDRFNLNSRINIFSGDAIDVIKTLNDDYDFVFIDASKSHYKDFFEAAEKKCLKGAVIVSDNVLLKASTVDASFDKGRRHRTNIKRMREFLNYLNEREDLSTALISCGDGLAITKLNEK